MTTTTLDTAAATGSNTAATTPSQDAAALVARILLASVFVLSGIAKLGAAEGTIGYIASVGLPFAEVVYYATLALEIGGGLLLIAGFKARQIAAVFGLFSIAAAVLFHADFADQNQMTHFLKNISIAGGMFAIAAFGPGKFSLSRS